ncbi:MAG: molybdopterin-dependent oxidoreductase [Caulobacterales bacterium]
MSGVKAAVLAIALSLAPLVALADDLTVVGPTGKTVTLTPADLANLPRASASLHEGDKTIAYEGVVLSAILREGGTPVGPMAHGKPMKDFVVVTSKDGYGATLSLAETDPEFRTGQVILADTMAGAPLDARQGPYRLIVGDDLKPWRAVRMVQRIEVKSAP